MFMHRQVPERVSNDWPFADVPMPMNLHYVSRIIDEHCAARIVASCSETLRLNHGVFRPVFEGTSGGRSGHDHGYFLAAI